MISDGTPRLVDAHLHVWNPATASYPWLTPDLTVLDRAFAMADAEPDLSELGAQAVVLVQAADNLADTANLFAQAARDPRVAGVVAWVPLDRPDEAARLLDDWRDSPAPVVGVRHLIHREPDPDWLIGPAVADGLELLAARGLSFDVCAENPALLAHVPVLAARHPGLRLVVDHLAKPPLAALRSGRRTAWREWCALITDAAAAPGVVAKISGLNTAAGPGWEVGDLRPAVEHALEVFGPDRLMVGSDWPFALLEATSYRHAFAAVLAIAGELEPGARDAVLAGTAERTYFPGRPRAGEPPATNRKNVSPPCP
ncbi:amidohydrolase family protein [Pengzhenrongella sp.]|uniref:amidohydrolase family protein n=1 Tax=Pengzhenrongella sp. TaxID=2888820 RepID=UPI002F9284B1